MYKLPGTCTPVHTMSNIRVFRFPLACLRYMAWLIIEGYRLEDPVINHPRIEGKPIYYMKNGQPIYHVNIFADHLVYRQSYLP